MFMNKPRFHDQITRGMAWLDEHMPYWRDRINTEKIDINCPHSCILGQTSSTGNYYKALDEFKMTMVESYELGFGFSNGNEKDYDDLTHEWKEAIRCGTS